MKPLLFFICLVGCTALSRGDDYVPRNTQKPGEEPPTAEEAAKLITVPEGFQVTLFAGDPDVRQPVAMALDDRARLFVAESYSYKEWEKKGEDRVLIFEDTDNDGRHDSRKVFVSGIDHLSGMTVGWGGVWVCSAPNLLFYPDANRDDIPDGEPVVVLDGWTTNAKHNFFNGLTWGPDGWLYGRHGITAPSKVGPPGTPDEERIEFDCAIWRYHPQTKEFEVVCRGTTNPWGLDWNEQGDLFFTNNVNGHLWHAIPGAYYPRMGNRNDRFAKYVYDRINMCCDHLHHAGKHTDWTKTRDGKGVHGELGGGHSHCGGMIYLGGKWPDQYKGKMFMCNTHGRRVNVDRLDEEGVTYVGRHEADFLHANNAWFRGVQLIYGPDGDVFLSDWVDHGECHDHDGVHRTSGRIYKIIHGKPSPPMQEKLWEMSNEELMTLANHKNHWFRRNANWVLWERVAAGKFNENEMNRHVSRHLPSPTTEKELRQRASELSRADPEHRWEMAIDLLKACPPQTEVTDLLIYYGIKDIAASDPDRSSELLYAAEDNHYLFTKNLSQNLAENGVFSPLIDLLESSGNEALSAVILTGFAEGIKGRTDLKSIDGWPEVFETYYTSPGELREKALSINLAVDEPGSIAKLAELLQGDKSEGEPDQALAVLRQRPITALTDSLLPFLDDPFMAPKVIPILSKIRRPEVARHLIEKYSSFAPRVKPLAINALAGNKRSAKWLLDAVSDGTIPSSALTAYHARQIQTYRDKALNETVAKVWGRTGSTSGEKKALIKDYQDQLLPDVLARADIKNGHAKFQQLCLSCHHLNGEGGNLGPDLTGANRDDLYYLLENIIDPSATLPADFQMTIITKKDDSVVSGNIAAKNEYTVTIRNPGGEQIVPLDEIKKTEKLPQSIMPEGLLTGLSFDDVRDLIGYLQK